MEATCSKCGKTKFEIIRRNDKAFCYVSCASCGNVVGVLEGVAFKKHYDYLIKYHDKTINNHAYFERRINDLESKIAGIEKDIKMLLVFVEAIYSRIGKIK